MNTLKEILLNGGYVTDAVHSELKSIFPNLNVCVKWGASPRQLTTLGSLESVLSAGKLRGDYLMAVFVPVSAFDKLREAFGITDQDQQEYYKNFL